MRILSLATIFPNPSEPGLGPFVSARLKALASLEPGKVVAPIAPFDYDNPQRRGLGKRGVPRRRQDGDLEVFHPAWGYPPRNPAMKGRLLALQIYPLLRRIRREFPFDFIDAQFAHPEGVAARLLAKAFGCPYAITMRGNELEFAASPSKRGKIRDALLSASAVITVSEQLRDLARDLGVAAEKIHKIGNGVDSAVYRMWSVPAPRDGRPVRILSAGRLIRLKRFDHIIQALAGLRDSGIEAQLEIAGGADRSLVDCRSELEAMARSRSVAEHVRFTGWIPPETLARRMAEADLFCLASSREGWPNVVHEALACGCPVVATRVGEIAELIPDDRSGLIVPVDDPDALLAALNRACEIPWDRRAIADRAGKRTWGTVAAEVANAFRSAQAR